VQSASAELVLLAAGAIGILAAAIGLIAPGVHRWRPFGDAGQAGLDQRPGSARR
jgi:hypothetical protein